MENDAINDLNPAPLEVMQSAAGTMKVLLLCVLVLVFAVSILTDNHIISRKAWGASWILLLLCPFVFFLLLRRLLRGGVQLRIDDQGIFYPTWSAMPIPWADISHVALIKAFSNYQLGISLYPAAQVHHPKLGGLAAKLSRRISKRDISITVTTMASKPADIMRAIHLHSGGRL